MNSFLVLPDAGFATVATDQFIVSIWRKKFTAKAIRAGSDFCEQAQREFGKKLPLLMHINLPGRLADNVRPEAAVVDEVRASTKAMESSICACAAVVNVPPALASVVNVLMKVNATVTRPSYKWHMFSNTPPAAQWLAQQAAISGVTIDAAAVAIWPEKLSQKLSDQVATLGLESPPSTHV